jgi:ERCC4-type nuclease
MSYKLNKSDDSILKIMLDIDYREQSIINILKEKGVYTDSVQESSININIKNLVIGDFVFKESTNENSTEVVHYIIERKTINDLCSSIKDGRFSEQKSRLLDTIDDPSKIIYIIEGDRNKILPIYNVPKSTIDSAIQNLIFKHKYKVIFTDSTEETIENILLLYKKLVNNDFESKGSTIKIVKKGTNSNQNVFMNMLCAIPGVNTKTAKAINYKYKSMNELIRAYDIDVSGLKELLLSDIDISEKRKLGISLSTKIYKSLFENSSITLNKKQSELCLL